MSEPATRTPLERLYDDLQWQAKQFHGYSPLYERLALGMMADPEIMALASHAQNRPRSLLFLAAIHYLLLQGAHPPLAAYYPSIAGEHVATGDPYPRFRDFCRKHREAILALVTTRRVQTNEVQRCACLLPAFGVAAHWAQGRPLFLVEIGASAGLNLLWDRYRYRYGDGSEWGAENSPVLLTCEVRGERPLPLPPSPPSIAGRVGIDLHPIDVRDPDSVLWLRALLWPEHIERAERLQRAVQVARSEPPQLLAGDGVELLSNVLAAASPDAVPCIYHTFTLYQWPREAREHFAERIAEQAAHRPLCHVSIEWLGTETPEVSFRCFENGTSTERLLARCDAHGRWIEPLAGP